MLRDPRVGLRRFDCAPGFVRRTTPMTVRVAAARRRARLARDVPGRVDRHAFRP